MYVVMYVKYFTFYIRVLVYFAAPCSFSFFRSRQQDLRGRTGAVVSRLMGERRNYGTVEKIRTLENILGLERWPEFAFLGNWQKREKGGSQSCWDRASAIQA